MACDVPPRQCLEWHIKPYLKDPRPSGDGNGYRALCPVHDDREHSFGVSVASSAKKRIVWNCFACKNRVRVRRDLIRAGVDPGCLPLSAAEKADLLDQLYRVATADTPDHGAIRFIVVAVLEGHKELPERAEVDRIAGLARVHRATGYRARKVLLPQTSTANPGSYTPQTDPVNLPTSEASSQPPSHVA